MTTVHAVLGAAVAITSLAAGGWGAWLWWRAEPQPGFWAVLRTAQAVLVVQVLVGALLLFSGREPPELHVLYGVLPVGVMFIGEQLRVASAEAVLAKRGLAAAREMEKLPDAEQHLIVLEIVRRETGVMAAAALVVVVLALRASGVAGGLLL